MKVAVIYASTTGNTEAMADAINEAVKASGEADIEQCKAWAVSAIK